MLPSKIDWHDDCQSHSIKKCSATKQHMTRVSDSGQVFDFLSNKTPTGAMVAPSFLLQIRWLRVLITSAGVTDHFIFTFYAPFHETPKERLATIGSFHIWRNRTSRKRFRHYTVTLTTIYSLSSYDSSKIRTSQNFHSLIRLLK